MSVDDACLAKEEGEAALDAAIKDAEGLQERFTALRVVLVSMLVL